MSATAPINVELPERYEVLRHIADGGMASVWCARDRLLGRRVAIKLLDARFQQDPLAIGRFQREARTAARLSGHRHVVTIFDVGEVGGRAFLVMEFLPGGTVAQALMRGTVSRVEASRWLHEAASALDHAHRCGIVHRDVKPGNLLLDVDRVLHITDFGIARAAREETITGAGLLFATPSYVAPELLRGGPATAASDRYALAVTAFELLAGQRPFVAENPAARAQQHLTEPPPLASDRDATLPPAVDEVLARGLAKHPADRWPTATDMAIALEGALSDTSPRRTYRARPTPFSPSLPGARGLRRAPRWAAVAALGAGVFAALALAFGAQRQSHPPLRAVHEARSHPAPARSTKPGSPRHAPTASPRTASAATGRAPLDPAMLEARGHQLMLDGSYGQAVSILRQAVASASPSSLTFAYALYDLGRSLRLSGDAQAAIPILRRRLQIPDQAGVVSQELLIAERQAGGDPTTSGGVAPQPLAPGPGAGKHHGHERHGDQQQD